MRLVCLDVWTSSISFFARLIFFGRSLRTMEDSAKPRPNKLHQLQQTLGRAQGAGDGSPKKRRSILDSALSTPRHRKGGGSKASASDRKKRRREAGPRNSRGGGRSNPSGNKNGGGKGAGGTKGNRTASSGNGTNTNTNNINNNSERPPPVVCSAFETLASRIRRRPTSSLEDLSKDQFSDLPNVPYTYGTGVNDKRIVLVTSAASSQSSVASIRAELQKEQQAAGAGGNDGQSSFAFLGFDVEIKPKFHQGGRPNPVAMVQLATKTTAHLFRLKYHGMGSGGAWTPELSNLLSDANIIKVGVGIRNDVQTLRDTYGANVGGDGTSYLDLTELVKVKWPLIRRCGLRNLTATVLSWRLSKAQQMKNWEMEDMTDAMIRYAAADAFIALDLLEAIVS